VAENLMMVDVAPSRQEIERRIAEVAAGRFRCPVMVLGIDGAYVPTHPDSPRAPSASPQEFLCNWDSSGILGR
jgi:hypothetical protein